MFFGVVNNGILIRILIAKLPQAFLDILLCIHNYYVRALICLFDCDLLILAKGMDGFVLIIGHIAGVVLFRFVVQNIIDYKLVHMINLAWVGRIPR